MRMIKVDDLVNAGLTIDEAKELHTELQGLACDARNDQDPRDTWRDMVRRRALKPWYPHGVHQLVFNTVYSNWDVSLRGPPPYWFPSLDEAKNTNLGHLMEKHGPELLGSSYKDPISSFSLFYKFSVQHPEVYWSIVLKELLISFKEEPKCILDRNDKSKASGSWLPGSVLNIVESCLLPKENIGKKDNDPAIIWSDESCQDLNVLTLKELRARVILVDNAINGMFSKGTAIAVDMPMTVNAVVIYLAIILSGLVVVSIPDSFSSKEIATRLRVSKAKAIFTQDYIIRGGRKFPLYSRVSKADPDKIIVVPANRLISADIMLRKQDIEWKDFVSKSSSNYNPFYQPIDSVINILFSSGTTGEPKAVPWTQLSTIRSSAETWAQLDLKAGDVYCWPTNLGWVLGPATVFSCLLTGATLALYDGSPLGLGFCKFIQDSGVTFLGSVPSLVKTWKTSQCTKGLDWTKIRVFLSSGEASNSDDDLWLSSQAYYKPVIEICGGTELSSSYIQGSLFQPQAFGAFTTPTMTTGLVILDENGIPYPDDQVCTGEMGLFALHMGATDWLLNANNEEVYFKGMPQHNGMQLRRHGDILRRTAGGFLFVQGRADDTMNLGGIKTSSVEIERVCNHADESILETIAVSVAPGNGGPEQLVIFVVLKIGHKSEEKEEKLRIKLSKAIQTNLNPLFKVSFVKIVQEFPRTASNKLLRRVLRERMKHELSVRSRM